MEGRRWEDMESDCLANVFARLDLEDLALGVPFVCKSWSRASNDPLCWRVLDLGELDFMPWSSFAKRFMAQCSPRRFSFAGFFRLAVGRSAGSAVELKFPLQFTVSLEDLEYAANKCANLKVLAWPRLLSGNNECILAFVEKWKDLKQLEMSRKPSCFPKLARQMSLSCKSLCALQMSGIIKAEDASAIVKYLPKLKCLELSRSFMDKDQLLVILNGCKELERLIIKDCIVFRVDNEEILRTASRIKTFEHEGSKLTIEDSGYETDDYDRVDVIF